MKYFRTVFATLWLLALTASAQTALAQEADAAPAPAAQPAQSTLIVDVLPFRSEQKLPKKADKQLRSGAIEWGMRGNEIVFTLVNRRFIDFPVDKMTRYGTSETFTLPAGTYRITGVGIEMTTGFDVQKILDRGAYVNENVVSFEMQPGKTTHLTIDPIIKKDATFAINFWVPDLMTSISEDGGTPTEPVALNARFENSIAWPNYSGPLKFITK